jgi:hypothetical protein
VDLGTISCQSFIEAHGILNWVFPSFLYPSNRTGHALPSIFSSKQKEIEKNHRKIVSVYSSCSRVCDVQGIDFRLSVADLLVYKFLKFVSSNEQEAELFLEAFQLHVEKILELKEIVTLNNLLIPSLLPNAKKRFLKHIQLDSITKRIFLPFIFLFLFNFHVNQSTKLNIFQ